MNAIKFLSFQGYFNFKVFVLMPSEHTYSYIFIMQMQRVQKDKQLPQSPLVQLFADPANTVCFQCGRPSKQWTDLAHAIFICLNCASQFKQLSWVTKVKSVGLDEWTSEDVERMNKGGNESFAKFMLVYGLQEAQLRTIITSRAAAYYRGMLDGKEMGIQPTFQVGREIYKEQIPLSEMSPDQLFQSAKEKAFQIGSKTKSLGEKGLKKIQEKYQSGQLKEGAKKVATSVSTSAKWLWGMVKEKANAIAQDIKK